MGLGTVSRKHVLKRQRKITGLSTHCQTLFQFIEWLFKRDTDTRKMHLEGHFNPISLLGNLCEEKCVNLSLLMFLMKREHQIGVMLSEPQSCLCLIQSNFPSSFHALLSLPFFLLLLQPLQIFVMFGLFSTCVYITMLTICLSIVVTATENSPFPSRVHHSQKSMIAVVESSVSIAFLTGSTIQQKVVVVLHSLLLLSLKYSSARKLYYSTTFLLCGSLLFPSPSLPTKWG